MTLRDIRVGIVGADTKASWAKLSHVPVINGLPGLKLAAVATRDARLIEAVRRSAERGERHKVTS
jgi:predicted dehydrogenase